MKSKFPSKAQYTKVFGIRLEEDLKNSLFDLKRCPPINDDGRPVDVNESVREILRDLVERLRAVA